MTDTPCPRHPGAIAIGTCERCGTFVCAQDVALLGTKKFCTDCSKRPDVDYLEAFRLKHWGKRDGWAWAFGLGALVNATVAIGVGAQFVRAIPDGLEKALPLLIAACLVALAAANGALFWLGKPIARWGALVLLLVMLGAQTVAMAERGAAAMGFTLGLGFFPLAVVVNLFSNWRTRLFFRLEVSRPKLQAAWDLLHNNTLARQSTIAGVVGLVIPGFCLIALLMAGIALRRVDPNAYPPIGKKGYAIAGLVLGVVGTLGWGTLALVTGFR